MSEFVYLMKNGDLYQLGSARNLETQAEKLRPGEIIASLEVIEPKSFEARLLRRYRRKRIPETKYFRLSEEEVNDCKKKLGGKSNFPKILSDEINIGLNGSLLSAILTFCISYLLNRMLIFSLFLSALFASFPMWVLAILGNFGGYDVVDLTLFSTFPNRCKGLLIAISMDSIAYVLYTFYGFSLNL